MAEIDIKDQLATLLKEIRAQTSKVEAVSASFGRITAALDRVAAKPVTAALDTALDASSTLQTASMVSSVDNHGAPPPSSRHSSAPIHSAELIPELPARCATTAHVHDVSYIPGAATPLCTRGVSAPSQGAPPAPARRVAAALELDKRTPNRCLMLGLGAAAFSIDDDAFADKNAGVVAVASEAARFAGLPLCTIPKVDAPVHTMCSAECSNINGNGTHGSKVSLLREDMFLGCSSPGKVQAFRPIPWPSFAYGIINFQPTSPWKLFKVTSGSKFRTDAITHPFEWCYPFNQLPWPPPQIGTIWWPCKGVHSQSELKPWPDELQHECTGDVYVWPLRVQANYSDLCSIGQLQIDDTTPLFSWNQVDCPAISSLCAALGEEWVLPPWDSGQQADASYDQSSCASQYTSCLPGYFLTGGQMQLSDACSTWRLFLSASSTSLLLAKFLVQAKEPSGILRYFSKLAEAKAIGRFHETESWWNYMLLVWLSWRLVVGMGWETIVLACFENGHETLQLLMLTLVLEQEALSSGVWVQRYMTLYLVQVLFFLASRTIKEGKNVLSMSIIPAHWSPGTPDDWSPGNQSLSGTMGQTYSLKYYLLADEWRSRFLCVGPARAVFHAFVVPERPPRETLQPDHLPRGARKLSTANARWCAISFLFKGLRDVYVSRSLQFGYSAIGRGDMLVLVQSDVQKNMDLCGFTTAILAETMSICTVGCSVQMDVTCLVQPDYGENFLKLIRSAASGFFCGRNLGLYWRVLTRKNRLEQYRDLMNILGHNLTPEGVPLLTWVTPIPVPQTFEVITSSCVMVIGKQLCTPWDPGGILQVFADGGLRASRMLRRGECHVPTVTWAVGCMPQQEGWAAAGSQAHFTLLWKVGPDGQEAIQLLNQATTHSIGIEEPKTRTGSLPDPLCCISSPTSALDLPPSSC